MAYQTDITKKFKSKGFINGLDIISTEKNDNGASYSIEEILENVGGDGDEVEFSIQVKEKYDSLRDA